MKFTNMTHNRAYIYINCLLIISILIIVGFAETKIYLEYVCFLFLDKLLYTGIK